MNNLENLARIAPYLPPPVRTAIAKLPEAERRDIQEIRLRAGRPAALTLPGRSLFLSPQGMTRDPANALIPGTDSIAQSLQAVVSYSLHSHRRDLAEGFVTVQGGCRVGICGTAVTDGERVQSVRNVSGLSFRIAGERPGTAERTWHELGESGRILVAGRPGCGKTTFLRDLCRLLGNRDRTALIDERGELAAMHRGLPQHDVGRMTDVLDGYPRSQGILTALRVLSPVYLLCDELSTDADAAAVMQAAGCGVQLCASVHAGSFAELETRSFLRPLLAAGVFRYCVMLTGGGQVQSVRTFP